MLGSSGVSGTSTSIRPSPTSAFTPKGTAPLAAPLATSSNAMFRFVGDIDSLNVTTIGERVSTLVPVGKTLVTVGSAGSIHTPSVGKVAGLTPIPPAPVPSQFPPKTQAGLSQPGSTASGSAARSAASARRRVERGDEFGIEGMGSLFASRGEGPARARRVRADATLRADGSAAPGRPWSRVLPRSTPSPRRAVAGGA